jgi:hypothetical protein
MAPRNPTPYEGSLPFPLTTAEVRFQVRVDIGEDDGRPFLYLSIVNVLLSMTFRTDGSNV